MSLEKIENACDYARYFPQSSRYLCYNLMTIWSQVDDKLFFSQSSSNNKAYYDQIWKQLWILMTDLDLEKHGNKLSALEALLCIHI